MTPGQRPQTSAETLRSNYYANIQAAGGQNGGQGMPPPVYMHQNGSMVSPTYGNTHAASMQLAMNTSFDSTQMQTPPPTRGASGKKPQQGQQIAFGTPSTIASRRFLTPQQPLGSNHEASLMQHNPMQFPQLQFSPETYQFANLGPASAPAMPQSRILWAQSGSPVQPGPPAPLDDPFAPAGPNGMSWLAPAIQQSNIQAVSFDTPAMNSFPVQAPHPRPATAVLPSSHPHAPIINEPASAGVDPSLLYSSPMRPVVRSNNRTKKNRPESTANGTHAKDDGKSVHSRSETASSTNTVGSRTLSTLQRSHTTSNTRPKSMNISLSASETLSRSNSINQMPRTASPVKRFGRPSLGSITEGRPKQRTSVILTIDENGRARTETKRVESSPTRSMRERYPALFDSDSSDEESDASEQTPSRPDSFIFDKRDERRSKAAKLDPPVENLEGLSIPRSSSAASMKKGVPPSRAAVAAAAQLRRQGSLRRSTPSRNSQRRSLMSSSATSLIDTYPMDVPTEQQRSTSGVHHVADQALDSNYGWNTHFEHALEESTHAETALEAHNRRWSMMSFEQQQHSQSISPQQQHYASGTFPDFGRQAHPLGRTPQSQQVQIRCVCGVPDVRGLALIQCHSCTQWLHKQCVGLESQANVPGFTCFICTRPPSNRPYGIPR